MSVVIYLVLYCKKQKRFLYNPLNSYTSECGLQWNIVRSVHMFQCKDLHIYSSHMQDFLHNRCSVHILVYNPGMDLLEIQINKCTHRYCIGHSNHKDLGNKDLVFLLDLKYNYSRESSGVDFQGG